MHPFKYNDYDICVPASISVSMHRKALTHAPDTLYIAHPATKSFYCNKLWSGVVQCPPSLPTPKPAAHSLSFPFHFHPLHHHHLCHVINITTMYTAYL